MSPTHPIWAIIRLTVLMIAMVFVLWLNATKFDHTEIRSIIAVFIAAATGEGILARVSKPQIGNLRLPGGHLVDSASYWRGFKDAGGES